MSRHSALAAAGFNLLSLWACSTSTQSGFGETQGAGTAGAQYNLEISLASKNDLAQSPLDISAGMTLIANVQLPSSTNSDGATLPVELLRSHQAGLKGTQSTIANENLLQRALFFSANDGDAVSLVFELRSQAQRATWTGRHTFITGQQTLGTLDDGIPLQFDSEGHDPVVLMLYVRPSCAQPASAPAVELSHHLIYTRAVSFMEAASKWRFRFVASRFKENASDQIKIPNDLENVLKGEEKPVDLVLKIPGAFAKYNPEERSGEPGRLELKVEACNVDAMPECKIDYSPPTPWPVSGWFTQRESYDLTLVFDQNFLPMSNQQYFVEGYRQGAWISLKQFGSNVYGHSVCTWSAPAAL